MLTQGKRQILTWTSYLFTFLDWLGNEENISDLWVIVEMRQHLHVFLNSLPRWY